MLFEERDSDEDTNVPCFEELAIRVPIQIGPLRIAGTDRLEKGGVYTWNSWIVGGDGI